MAIKIEDYLLGNVGWQDYQHWDFSKMGQVMEAYLGLDHHMVGIERILTQEAYETLNVEPYKGRAYYCQFIKKATKGACIKAGLEHFSCDTAARVLGLTPYYDETEGIDGWENMGLYETRDIAQLQHETVQPIETGAYGVHISPISRTMSEADVVIIPCNPAQAMRLTQAYTFGYGFKKDIKISGQCGVCFESSALPLRENDLSISMLCSGTRFFCKWPDDTMMVAFPGEMLAKLLIGLAMTAQGVETDHRKHVIHRRLHKIGIRELVTFENRSAYYYGESK